MAIMIEPKLEVPAELRDLAEKTIDQAEKAFGMFFDAAGKSMTSMPGAGSTRTPLCCRRSRACTGRATRSSTG